MIHAHVAGRVYGETKERLRERRCPACQHERPAPEQAASGEDEAAGVALCEKCGVELPAAGTAAADAPAEADPEAPAE